MSHSIDYAEVTLYKCGHVRIQRVFPPQMYGLNELYQARPHSRVVTDKEKCDGCMVHLGNPNKICCNTTTKYVCGHTEVMPTFINKTEAQKSKEISRAMGWRDDWIAVKDPCAGCTVKAEKERAAREEAREEQIKKLKEGMTLKLKSIKKFFSIKGLRDLYHSDQTTQDSSN